MPFYKNKKIMILSTLFISLLLVTISYLLKKSEKNQQYNEMIESAKYMKNCIDIIKNEQKKHNIVTSKFDKNNTGIIGFEKSILTNKNSDLNDKIITANYDMAALIVKILAKSNIKENDIIYSHISSDYPGLNIALLSACEVLHYDIIYTASLSSSQYGGNNPDFNFLDMIITLYNEKKLSKKPMITFTNGLNKIKIKSILEKIKNNNIDIVYNYDSDFEKTIKQTLELLEKNTFDFFINIGNDDISIGKNDYREPIQNGSVNLANYPNKKSGLIDILFYKEKSIINLNDIKILSDIYDFDMKNTNLIPIGENKIYYTHKYPSFITIPSILIITMLLFFIKKSNPI